MASDPKADTAGESTETSPPLSEERKSRILTTALKRMSKRIKESDLRRVLNSRELILRKFNSVPRRMQSLTNQVELLLELIGDYWDGTYRRIPWYSLASTVGALLYTISPADVIPDYIPGLGQLDDLAVAALALRWTRKDLIRYCEFKGYDPEDYFGEAAGERPAASSEPASEAPKG